MRTYLKRCGIDRGIRPVINPGGSGFTFVLNSFATQVNSYRCVKARKRVWLIAIVDADTGTVAQRLGQMDTALDKFPEPRTRAILIRDEKIARLVPRRHIETWILALNAERVDETEKCKDRIRTDEQWLARIPAAASTFYQLTRPNATLPVDLIDSLRRGVQEMNRLFQMAL